MYAINTSQPIYISFIFIHESHLLYFLYVFSKNIRFSNPPRFNLFCFATSTTSSNFLPFNSAIDFNISNTSASSSIVSSEILELITSFASSKSFLYNSVLYSSFSNTLVIDSSPLLSIISGILSLTSLLNSLSIISPLSIDVNYVSKQLSAYYKPVL